MTEDKEPMTGAELLEAIIAAGLDINQFAKKIDAHAVSVWRRTKADEVPAYYKLALEAIKRGLPPMRSIGHLRVKRSLSQLQLANWLGVSVRSIIRYENSSETPMALQLAAAEIERQLHY